jgi:DNA-binding transcriptional ArsR family regulator
MPRDPLEPARCAELLSALAAPERLKIVRLLADGPQSVGAMAETLAVIPVNLSHHLNVLRAAGIIDGTKKGRYMWYSLRPGVLDEVTAAGVPKEVLDLGCCQLLLPKVCDDKAK